MEAVIAEASTGPHDRLVVAEDDRRYHRSA
jgi:hypothetical protein